MSVRMRHTVSHTRNRRSHHALKEKRVNKCVKCGESVLPHTACLNCGTYKGRVMIDVLSKLTKKEKKLKEKELKDQEASQSDGNLDPAKLSQKN